MWIIYAVAASVIWGVSYASSGRVIEHGMAPLTFFFYYACFGAIAGALALAAGGRLGDLTGELRALGSDWPWFALALISSAAGTLLIYMAIGEKNATLASLIEMMGIAPRSAHPNARRITPYQRASRRPPSTRFSKVFMG